MTRSAAVAVPLIDDERVRVTRFEFTPGAETGWHVHEFDYVITAITDCQMALDDGDGTLREVMVPAGTAYRRDKGVAHNVINGGSLPMSFVEMELKEESGT